MLKILEMVADHNAILHTTRATSWRSDETFNELNWIIPSEQTMSAR